MNGGRTHRKKFSVIVGCSGFVVVLIVVVVVVVFFFVQKLANDGQIKMRIEFVRNENPRVGIHSTSFFHTTMQRKINH